MRKTSSILLAAFVVASCSTTESGFYKDPKKQPVENLCRAWARSSNSQFRRDVENELISRGVTSAEECQKRVNLQNAVIAGIAIAGVAVAASAASKNGYGGGYGGYSGYGSYGVAWDQFYDPYFNLIWRCRDRSTGRFVDDYRCQGKLKTDSTWPGWRA